ncbi:uncharacterized protein LOC125210193 [Salvia hispanica]|uniref:uncharacterized protein LOC125210193 n=1 Tax=Salvia hispanica TaxID=49212 RepID=UPI0020097B0B|nr:uncharacterized protein LOC125210193 [Salvia hispanica]
MPPLTKCMVALRQLAYGTTTDMFDEHLHVGDTTGRECLAKFCESVVDAFDTTYLCKPNVEDSWKGQFTNGYRGTHPTMILEAILDHRIWIWHAHFGMAGSNNDINVLNTSSLFTEQCNGNGLLIEFTTNGRQHHMGYYLADDMYPRWPVFLKTISCPTDPRSRGKATLGLGGPKGPPAIEISAVKPQLYIANVMYACIILHNMIIHDEGTRAGDWSDDEAESSVGHTTPPFIRGLPMESMRDYK